jgi:hypothetical protein
VFIPCPPPHTQHKGRAYNGDSKVVSELVSMATAVAKGVAKDILYLNTWLRRNLALALAVAANLDTA